MTAKHVRPYEQGDLEKARLLSPSAGKAINEPDRSALLLTTAHSAASLRKKFFIPLLVICFCVFSYKAILSIVFSDEDKLVVGDVESKHQLPKNVHDYLQLEQQQQIHDDNDLLASSTPASLTSPPSNTNLGDAPDDKDQDEVNENNNAGNGNSVSVDDAEGKVTLHNKQTQPQSPQKKSQSNLLETVQDMSQRFASAKQQLLSTVSKDYGEENFRNMFITTNSTSRGRTAFVGGEHGWDRMKRKVTIKLLQVLLLPTQRQLQHTDSSVNNKELIPFVWATAGNSVAAGHGNLMNESYTAVLERAIQPVWESVGMSFEGRNYGVSGAISAPEIAFCQQSKFGTDVDALLWDFAVTDGRAYHFLELFLHRMALTPSRPAAIVMPRQVKGKLAERIKLAMSMGKLGMTTLYMDEGEIVAALDQVPDSFGKSEAEIDAMPEYVRSFKCEGQLELGDPHCTSRRFTNSVCNDRAWRVNWHPGWKMHAVLGNLMALFMVEVLEDALRDLLVLLDVEHDGDNSTLDLKEKLAELIAQEAADYQQVRNSTNRTHLPKYAQAYHKEEDEQEDAVLLDELRGLYYYSSPFFCHTAQLPAEIRYKGILFETKPFRNSDLTYHEGIRNIKKALKLLPPNNNETNKNEKIMRLVEDDATRQDCPIPLNLDHRDSFFVGSREGWKHLILPNDAELRAYGTGAADGDGGGEPPLKGIIIVCMVGCHQKIVKKDVHFHVHGGNMSSKDNSLAELEVNGVKVDSLLSFGSAGLLGGTCYLLRRQSSPSGTSSSSSEDSSSRSNRNREDDRHVWKPDERGRFRIAARATEKGTYIRFSSIIIS